MTDLRIPDQLARLYTHPGPFLTVYLDGTQDTEHGAHEVELRWRELRAALQAENADGPTLEALDDAVAAGPVAPGRHGRVLVGTSGTVVLDEALPNPPDRPRARRAPLPDLVAYLAQSAPRIAHVVVIADHAGADIVSVDAASSAAGVHPPPDTVAGSAQYPLHKTGRDEWDERHFQNRVENSWASNARDVAAETQRRAQAIGAGLVVLAGDPRARGLLRTDLPDVLHPDVEIVEVEPGGRAAGASQSALADAVDEAVRHRAWRARREVLEHVQQNLGRERYAVAGVDAVLDAVRASQADTVVLSDDPSSTLTAWIGPEPLQLGLAREDLHAMGVAEPQRDRFDAALLRAIAGSGAGLLVTPNAHKYVTEGIGALLRYDHQPTPA